MKSGKTGVHLRRRNMKSRFLMLLTAITLFAALAMPSRIAAQTGASFANSINDIKAVDPNNPPVQISANIWPYFCISLSAIQSSGDTKMKSKKRESLLGVLLSTGLYLLDNLRERVPDNMDDIKDRARETYETASERLGRATDALAGKEDSQMLGKVGALLIGVGIGVGVGLLIAPARGEETRANIGKNASDFGEKVRDRKRKPQGATGTHGE
jgi:hypothetical protein